MTDAELQKQIDELAADIEEYRKTTPGAEEKSPIETENPWR